jgi:hypothetical protein
MDDLQLEILGFDFRGPASSEALNEFLEKMNKDLGSLIASAYEAKHNLDLLSNQTVKQTYALCRKLSAVTSLDNGSVCLADLSDTTVLLTTDRNGDSIDSTSRLVQRQQNACILPPVEYNNWLSRYSGTTKYVAAGVRTAIEAIQEDGDVYDIPLELAISGKPAIFFERQIVSPIVCTSTQETSLFFSVPPSLTGAGYPASNYLSFIPFPLYTESIKVWYATEADPALSREGSTWYDWPSYVTDLYHNDVYATEHEPLYTSFPSTVITAIRIDIQQPYYLTESGYYIYSYGLGELELGLMKPSCSNAMGTIKIQKPSGNFTTVETDAANVTFANVPTASVDEVLTTYAWIDPEDATIAYVEISIDTDALETDIIPIITEVSVDYV